MSNLDARVAHTLPPSRGEPLGAGGQARRGEKRIKPRLLSAVMFAGDLVSGAVGIAAAAVIVSAATGDVGLVGKMRVQAGLLLLLLLGINCSLGLYRTNIRNPMELFRLRISATLLFVFAGVLMWIRTGSLVQLAVVPIVGVVAPVLGLWIEHVVRSLIARFGLGGAPAAILGTGASSRAIARLLLGYPGCGLRPIGFIDDEARPNTVVDEFVAQAGYDPSSGLPTLGTLDGWHGEGGAEVIVVPDETILPQAPAALYRLRAKQVLVVTRLGEFPTFGLQVRNAGRFVAIELNGEPGAYSAQLKRAIDIIVALALLIPAAPLIALLALAIKLTDPGPVFYGQWRVGQFGRPIRIFKLRTMYKDAEERLERVLASSPELREQWQRHFKLDQDPRILPHVGTLMRRASLDELPQLWNVVRGDMSLVGPRPFPAYHMDAFDAEFRALRASVPPGLTGLWQISSRSNGDLAVQRAEDSLYVKNRSLWLDLYILIATLPAVIGATGAK